MSSLALATGRLAPGVWRPDELTANELLALATGLGWATSTGRIDNVEDKTTFLTELGRAAGVPSYVRPNWDGIADGLKDLHIDDRCLLVIEAPRPSPFDSIAVEVLDEAVGFWARHGRQLQVVWFGPVEVPSLADVSPPKRSRRR